MNTGTNLDRLNARLTADPTLKGDLEAALARGGLPAAMELAAERGLVSGGQELSDLELELISAGKVINTGGWGGWGWGVRVTRVGFWF